jgi:hypothetical protein
MNDRDPAITKLLIRAGLIQVLCAGFVTAISGQHGSNVKGVSLEGRAPSHSIAVQLPAPFDLVWDKTDLNGIPMNPKWGWQRAVPPTPPDLEGICLPPLDSGAASNNDPTPFRDPRCTTQNPLFDEASGWRLFTCGLASTTAVIGHVNWMAVTYEGWIYWEGYQAFPHALISDDDYNFRLFPVDGAGVYPNKDGTFGLEFKAKETIKCFSGWWDQFRIAVDSGKDKAGQLVDGKFAIVTGLMGLDCEHGCQTELHPVWGLAIHVKDDPSDDVWAIFVRNWGSEGYCSHLQHYIDFPPASLPPPSSELSEFTLQLPWRTGATSVSVGNGSKFCMNSAAVGGPVVASVLNQGVLVKFTLPGPDTAPRANGELHLQWGGDQLGSSGDKPPAHLNNFAVAGNFKDSEVHGVEARSIVDRMTEARRLRYSSYIAQFQNTGEMEMRYLRELQNIRKRKMNDVEFRRMEKKAKQRSGELRNAPPRDSVCRSIPSGASKDIATLPVATRAPKVRNSSSPQLELEAALQDDAVYYAFTGRTPESGRRTASLHTRRQPLRKRK